MTSLHQLDRGAPCLSGVIDLRRRPAEVLARLSEEERRLWQRWVKQHDIAAAHQLARLYRNLVIEVAMDHCGGGSPSDAVIAEAQIGLMRAICRFSRPGNTGFRRYAASLMRVAILEGLCERT